MPMTFCSFGDNLWQAVTNRIVQMAADVCALSI